MDCRVCGMPLFDEVICEGCGTYVATAPPPRPPRTARPSDVTPMALDGLEPASVEAPLGDDALGPKPRCEKHPAFPLVATCAGCGTGLCIRCAPRRAESSAQPLCRLCRPVERADDLPAAGPRGVGGGLLLFTLGTAVWSLFYVTIGFFALAADAVLPGLICVGTALVGAVTVVAILARRRVAFLLMLGVLALDFLATMVGRGDVRATMSSCLWAMVWVCYLGMSRRVRNTLVR